MKCSYSVEKNEVLNVVELGDGEPAYIRLGDGKKCILRA
jgi:hypothetical protein